MGLFKSTHSRKKIIEDAELYIFAALVAGVLLGFSAGLFLTTLN
tara:strand:+ start:796 stop:927 length:132 start_codon:yes stop_codon:yes gene_type:complete